MTFIWQKRSDGYYLEDKKSGGGMMANFRELQMIEEIAALKAERDNINQLIDDLEVE